MRQLFYYKMRQKLITKCVRFFITKCDSFIIKRDSCYKMNNCITRRDSHYKNSTLQFATVKWETWQPWVWMNPQFWFFTNLRDHRRILFCNAINDFMMRSMISWWINFFFHFVLLLERTFGWAWSLPMFAFVRSPFRIAP